MISFLFRLFERGPSPGVQRAANVLLLGFSPVDAWDKARSRQRAATSRDEEQHWTAVMRQIERQTGYEHGADVATRYEIENEREAKNARNRRG